VLITGVPRTNTPASVIASGHGSQYADGDGREHALHRVVVFGARHVEAGEAGDGDGRHCGDRRARRVGVELVAGPFHDSIVRRRIRICVECQRALLEDRLRRQEGAARVGVGVRHRS
jgi:hypothetical protein